MSTMSIKTAEDCFVENIKLFANPRTEPEKYNLYNGLANLAMAISELQSDLRKIQFALNSSR